MRLYKWLIPLTILISGAATVNAEPGYDRVTGRAHASRSEVIAPHGMAATSQPLATQIALDILKAAYARGELSRGEFLQKRDDILEK